MPKRLTGWDKDKNGVPHAYVVKCFEGDGCPDMDTSKCNFCDDLVSTYDKLAAYEDSGLTPEDVMALAHTGTAVKTESLQQGTWQYVGRRGVRFRGQWIAQEMVCEHYGKRVFVREDGAVIDGSQQVIFSYVTSPALSSPL